jgi:hypothetical protein
MYKYKKTVIINNRRRRIFSKEKSNTEYILYKKEYITLNAYNKKTGGGLINNFLKKVIGEKNEFEIPRKNIDGLNGFDEKGNLKPPDIYNENNSKIISEYFKSDIILLYKYNEYNSNLISKYLKSNLLIANDTDKKYWIITDYDKNKHIIKVRGYTTYEWILQYSKDKLNFYFSRYCYKNHIILDNTNLKNTVFIFLKTYKITDENIFIYFIDNDFSNISFSDETKAVYKKLEKQYSSSCFKIYYILTDALYDTYNIHQYYELFTGYMFQCINILNNDIIFKYKTNYLKIKQLIEDNSIGQLINYGKLTHSKYYAWGTKTNPNIRTIKDFNDQLGAEKNISEDKVLYFYKSVDNNGIKEYNKLFKDNYFIYFTTIITNDEYKIIINNKNKYTLPNTLFEFDLIKVIDILRNKKYVILKYIEQTILDVEDCDYISIN